MPARDKLRCEGREILDVAAIYAADRYAMAHGVAGPALMERAGEAVARAADRLLGRTGRLLVLAGPGNNGGDGYVAARLLAARGHAVRVAALVPPESLKGNAAQAAARWQGETVPLEALVEEGEAALLGVDVVIDALFGAGLDRPLEGAAAAAVALVDAARRRGMLKVLAVDVPSGIHGDAGRPPEGGMAVQADVTVTFFRKKPAHLLHPGRLYSGQVIVADIGIPDSALEEVPAAACENHPDLWRHLLPVLTQEIHKYQRGSLMVLTGDALHTGASRLVAMAGLKVGAGAVTLAGAREALLTHAAHLTEVMLHPVEDVADWLEALAARHVRAVVIGPAAGVDERTRAFTLAVLERARRVAVVLDADVFSVFAEDPETLFKAIGKRRGAVVMTPHEGEFARLFPDLAYDRTSLKGKLERVKEAAARAGCTVLLKGTDTVIADARGRAVIEAHGAPWLATAGSGDVLAGLIGGLLAQEMPPLAAAAAGAWLHAEAGWRAGPAMVAAELIPLAGLLRAEVAGTEAAWRRADVIAAEDRWRDAQ